MSNPGWDLQRVIMTTGCQRLRPVFLTTFTTGFGLLPLASGVSVDLIGREDRGRWPDSLLLGAAGLSCRFWSDLRHLVDTRRYSRVVDCSRGVKKRLCQSQRLCPQTNFHHLIVAGRGNPWSAVRSDAGEIMLRSWSRIRAGAGRVLTTKVVVRAATSKLGSLVHS